MGRFDGKVTVIAGATGGIGLRTAEAFASEGAREAEGAALTEVLGENVKSVRASSSDRTAPYT